MVSGKRVCRPADLPVVAVYDVWLPSRQRRIRVECQLHEGVVGRRGECEIPFGGDVGKVHRSALHSNAIGSLASCVGCSIGDRQHDNVVAGVGQRTA